MRWAASAKMRPILKGHTWGVLRYRIVDIPAIQTEMLDLTDFFIDCTAEIFQKEYTEPRPGTITLQLPKNGVGNWCNFDIHPDIDDSGLRAAAGGKGWIEGSEGIPLATPETGKNVVYTSLWDNYPDSITVPLGAKAWQVSLMMVGSTNAMQSGEVVVQYCDGGAT